MGVFLVLLLFFVLEALTILMWVCGTIAAAVISGILLYGDQIATPGDIWGLFVVWGVLFAIPEILLMVQSAVWCRGLTQTAKDLGLEPMLPDEVKEKASE